MSRFGPMCQYELLYYSHNLSFLSMSDYKIKFNIYLLYSTRRKDSKKNDSIHIDIYEKFSLLYRLSLLFPVPFTFLPVHHLAFLS